jgi:ribosomal protein L7Ae-like RNA K-turn-binding protein
MWEVSNERSLKVLIVAVDLKKIQEEYSPDYKLYELISLCEQKQIPIIYSCTRKELGFSLYGRRMRITTKASVIGIINYQGFEKVT